MRVLRWAGRFWTGVLILIVLLAALLLGLRLLLPLLSAPPTLLDAAPPDGADGVSPRARLALRFSGPMNPRSVEQALALSPAVPWRLIWNDDRTTLTVSPTQNLRPDTNYRLTLHTTALSQRFRALAQPIELRFRTAPAPAVVRVLPADNAGDVPLTSPISIQFSRTIVPTSSVMLPARLPELRFEPPIVGSVTWLDQATALFRPAEPLRPGTRYRATLDAALTDIAGTQLNSPFTWSFSTPAPAVLAVAPADGTDMVAPRATLSITLSQPLDLDSVRASLAITPSVQGDLAATSLPDGRQVILYAPYAGWQPATTYAITLGAGAAPAVGNLPLLAPRRWSFTTAPQPALTGRFPGEGQMLPPGQEIRLIFNTPIDDQAIRKVIQFTPHVEAVRVTASETDVRIAADVRAATIYTMTLPATLADRNGIPLGREYQLRFLTAPAAPTLALPDVPDHLAQALPGQPVGLLIRRTNLSALSFDLYKLDETAVVRALGFQPGDWSLFQPERYGQPLLRSWNVPLADQLNTPATDRVALAAADGAPLPAGAYYLRIRTPEGPRADLLLLVSRTRLTLQSSSGAALVWATDVISGTPIGGLPVALYQAGVLTEQGTTDANGLLRFARSTGAAQPISVALASSGQFGAVSSAQGDADRGAREATRGFLTTDRAAYRPGERVELAGIVRATAAPSGTLALPQDRSVSVSVRPPNGARIYHAARELRATGVFSAGLTLPTDAPPGQYVASATIDGATFQTTFAVQPAGPMPLQVAVSAPPALAAGEAAPLQVQVRTPEGLPVAAAAISWTLDAERAPLPTIGDYVFGDDERSPASIAAQSGTGQADGQGRFSLVISDTVAGDMPLRYRLIAQATEPGGLSATAEGSFLVAPAPILAGVRLPSRIFQAGVAGMVELLALTPDGQTAPRANLRVEVYRRLWERGEETRADGTPRTVWRPRDKLAFVRGAVAGADGVFSLPLTLPAGGAYRLHVSTTDVAGRAAFSATTLWATAPGFTGWGELPGGQPLLIADRTDYRPGDTATLLLAAPFARSPVLITRYSADDAAGEARTIRAGEPFTLTVRSQDAPVLQVAVLFAGHTSLGANAVAPPPPLLATGTLPVRPERPALTVALASNASAYAPAATAMLTVTTVDASGAGVPADLIVSVAGASAAPQNTIADAFSTGAPPLATVPMSAPPPLAAPGVYWNSALRTGASGILTLTLPLPGEPAELRALVWAVGPAGFGQAESSFAITRPVALQIDAPPFFRSGDEVELAARVQNISPIAQDVQATLSFAGIQLKGDVAITQRALLAPGASDRFVWRARVLDVAGVSLHVSVQAGSVQPQFVQIERPILPAGTPLDRGGGALVVGRFTQVLTTPSELGGAEQLALELSASSAALAHADGLALAVAPERSLLDEASLLLITAPLSDTRTTSSAALDRLLAGQNADGGWGWWPRGQSEPFVTAVALEALAGARAAGLAAQPAAVERGLARLQLALNAPVVSGDERAHMLYVLSLYDRAEAASLRALAADTAALGPPGLAYLLLARPSAAAQDDRAALDRLAGLALRQGDQASWPARRDGATLDTDINVTALALLALEHARPDDELAAGARRWLAAAAPASGYERARALAALRASDPPDSEASIGRYTVTLNGSELLDGPLTDVLTSTRSLRVPLDPAHAGNVLTVTSAGVVFLRYRLSAAAPVAAPHDGGIALLREYLGPVTGRPLDLTQLRAGQLVRARLTVVTAAPRRFLDVADPLPGGAVVVAAGPSDDFEYAGRTTDHLTLARATVGPGIYRYSYLLRVVANGRYAVPAPTASAAVGATGIGNTIVLEVATR